jgi:hypothetical protein
LQHIQQQFSNMKFSNSLLKAAWAIVKASKIAGNIVAWATALKKAIAAFRLKTDLQSLAPGQVKTFSFLKIDGVTVRKATAVAFPADYQVKGTGKESPLDSIIFWCAENLAIRSFKIQNLINVA